MTRPTPFFVTGMPRSRTAWLAAWLTTDTTLCLHDSPANCLPPVVPGIRAGLSGPEVCMAFKDFTACWPESPWLIVDRVDARLAFAPILRKHVPDLSEAELDDWWKKRAAQLAIVANGRRTIMVGFEELDSLPMAKVIWRHLLGEKPFDEPRWRLMNDLNIQQERVRHLVKLRN